MKLTFKVLQHMNKILKNQHVQTLVQVKKHFYNIIRTYGITTVFKKILGIGKMLTMKSWQWKIFFFGGGGRKKEGRKSPGADKLNSEL
jgi:hypothetical protein